MRLLSIYKTAERSVPPSQEEMAKMGKLVEEGMKAGFLLAVEGCLPSALGDLLFKLGRFSEAQAEFERAASLTQNARERELLLGRARACVGVSTPPEPQ